MTLSQLLVQFVFRVSFGLAGAMALTPARLVTSGFYRVHLWVLMGLNTLAALVLFSQRIQFDEILTRAGLALGLAAGLAALCYFGSVIWLYERQDLGSLMLWAIAVGGLIGAIVATPLRGSTASGVVLAIADLGTSGLLLGATLAAMFLGHWYLNTPTMQLMPLRRLIAMILLAIAVRVVVSGTGLALVGESPGTQFWIFVAFRWLSGILGTAVFALMAWQALRVPNTQSATGILYAAVVVVFIGELTSQLLSVDRPYPL